MKRRGFLGGMVGAAVAGPSLASQAAQNIGSQFLSSQAAQGQVLGKAYGLTSGLAGAALTHQAPEDYGVTMLARIAGMTPAQRAKIKARTYIERLDPDIESYKSISMSAKIDWQKERNVDARINNQKSAFERLVNKIADTDDLADWF
jgi:hypothetical protein